MHRDDYIMMLKSHDDPAYWEFPPGFDYNMEIQRFEMFVSDLKERLERSQTLQIDSSVQDASFLCEISVEGVFLRFSNFGNMLATTDDESLSPTTLSIIRYLAICHGYVFIPHDLLEEKYTGDNPGVTGIRNWWIRYFDYV